MRSVGKFSDYVGMEALLRILPIINVAIYIFAFSIAYLRGQKMTLYVVLFVIQLVLAIMEVKRVGHSGGGDAAGNGMALGFLHLIYRTIQAILLIVLIIVFVRKVF